MKKTDVITTGKKEYMTQEHFKELSEKFAKKYNPEGSLLRKNQKELVEILKVFADICDKHGIQWWLSSGTLLGAARHKGFIPWDDDIDVVMLRKDYRKLKKILCAMKSDEYFPQCMETDIEYVNTFMKFRKIGTRLDTLNRRTVNYKHAGLFIDIFCVEYTNRICAYLGKRLYHAIQHPTIYVKNKWIRRPLIRLAEFLTFVFIMPVLRLFGKINPNHEYHYEIGSGWADHTFYLKDTLPLTTLEFEGVEFPVPKDTDAYLTNVYGDWRKVPDDEQIMMALHSREYLNEIYKGEWKRLR